MIILNFNKLSNTNELPLLEAFCDITLRRYSVNPFIYAYQISYYRCSFVFQIKKKTIAVKQLWMPWNFLKLVRTRTALRNAWFTDKCRDRLTHFALRLKTRCTATFLERFADQSLFQKRRTRHLAFGTFLYLKKMKPNRKDCCVQVHDIIVNHRF